MKHFIIYIFILISIFGYAQDRSTKAISITYTYANNYYKNIETLVANQEKAVYITKELHEQTKDTGVVVIDDNHILKVNQVNLAEIRYHSNINTNKVHYFLTYEGKSFEVIDSVVFKWEFIENDTRTIGGFLCNKAKLNYRGRNYTAYYTQELPISFGPYKFKGLPGAILYMRNSDDENNVHEWMATKVVYPFTVNGSYFEENGKGYTPISMQEYDDYIEKLKDERRKVSNSRAPKGVKMDRFEVVRLGIETIYEWEK